MVFSERQKLAEEIIFLSEKRGITGNDLQLQKVGDFGAKSLSASSELDTKHKASCNH
jgi:hypothetical protein